MVGWDMSTIINIFEHSCPSLSGAVSGTRQLTLASAQPPSLEVAVSKTPGEQLQAKQLHKHAMITTWGVHKL